MRFYLTRLICFLLSCGLFVCAHRTVIADDTEQRTIFIIEQGHHRIIASLLALLSGKAHPNQIIGLVDDRPISLRELRELYDNRRLYTEQKGFHLTVENMADTYNPELLEYDLKQLKLGKMVQLRQIIQIPSNAALLQDAASYEKIPALRFGWYAPGYASVDELFQDWAGKSRVNATDAATLSGQASSLPAPCAPPSDPASNDAVSLTKDTPRTAGTPQGRTLANFTTAAYRTFGPNFIGAMTSSVLRSMGVDPKYADLTGGVTELWAEWRAESQFSILQTFSYMRQRSGELFASTLSGISAARLYGQQIASLASALSRYSFYSAQSASYSALNSIRALSGHLGNMLASGSRALLRPVTLPGNAAASAAVGGAVLAAPALVYTGFQREYSEIRTEHAKSTEDCQSLSHQLYWSQRQRCENQFSADNSQRLECLERARNMYKRELRACMDEFNSGFSSLFF